jgi:spore maturation protein CgeB
MLQTIVSKIERTIFPAPYIGKGLAFNINKGVRDFVMCVGTTFDSRIINAMYTARLGYCNAFEQLGFNVRLIKLAELEEINDKLVEPIIFLYSSDLNNISQSLKNTLRNLNTIIWAQYWFTDQKKYFDQHGFSYLNNEDNSDNIKNILEIHPKFVFSANTPSGEKFFEKYTENGIRFKSLPLAFDTVLYGDKIRAFNTEFHHELVFIGGYWASKAVNFDKYLRPYEKKLTIYGRNQWPYSGYKGKISFENEAIAYRSSKVCPVVNEPSVKYTNGQINERIFKVLGAGGCPVVDDIQCFRELFEDDELHIPESINEYHELISTLLTDDVLNTQVRTAGRKAVLEKHTYISRAKTILRDIDE